MKTIELVARAIAIPGSYEGRVLPLRPLSALAALLLRRASRLQKAAGLVFAAGFFMCGAEAHAQVMPADSLRQSAARTVPSFLPAAVGSAFYAEQVDWVPGMAPIGWAATRSRYNRIEALSLAAVGGKDLERDRTITALLRIGVADLVPNGELTWARERGFRRNSISAYNRLMATNEWGNPLALGASLGAFFLGRDEGFYYRAGGVEMVLIDSTRSTFHLRLFAERHRTARVKNDFSVPDIFGSRTYPSNIVARDGDLAGMQGLIRWRRGVEATEVRLFGEVKIEAATGDFSYGRAMGEGIYSVPVTSGLLGVVTVSGGYSGGELPPQRHWYLGGTRSVRGQRPGVVSGDAFWMTQVEAAALNIIARPVLFFDAGWAGSRADIATPGRIATGAGVGASIFDGTLRFDLARGIYPGNAWRGALYLEARM